jgi:hypothetical protein
MLESDGCISALSMFSLMRGGERCRTYEDSDLLVLGDNDQYTIIKCLNDKVGGSSQHRLGEVVGVDRWSIAHRARWYRQR